MPLSAEDHSFSFYVLIMITLGIGFGFIHLHHDASYREWINPLYSLGIGLVMIFFVLLMGFPADVLWILVPFVVAMVCFSNDRRTF